MSEQSVENKSLIKKFHIEDILGFYFRPKDFETKDNGKLYRYLGVRLFKKILPTGGDYVNKFIIKRPWWSLEALIKDNNNNVEFAVRSYYFGTCAYETLHLGMQAVMTYPLIIKPLNDNNLELFFEGLLTSTVINIYPIMLQRYNRARISRVTDKLDKRKLDKRDEDSLKPRSIEDIDKEIEELRLETRKYFKTS